MQANDPKQQGRQAADKNTAPPELWHPQAQRPLNEEEGEQRAADAEQDPRTVPAGAPGKPIDDVGGPGLGVPPGGKNREGASGASGSTER